MRRRAKKIKYVIKKTEGVMTKNEVKEKLIKDGFDPRYSGKKRCFFITKPRGVMLRDIVDRPVTVKDVERGEYL